MLKGNFKKKNAYLQILFIFFNMNENENFNIFVKYISSLNPQEFTAVACIFGFLLSAPLDATTQQSLGNFFECLGQVMLTISSQKFANNNNNGNNNNINY